MKGKREMSITSRRNLVVLVLITLSLICASGAPPCGVETAGTGGELLVVWLDGQETPWGVKHIGADNVHQSDKGHGAKVAILDTGIDLDHPDLKVAGDVSFVPGVTSGDDDHGHGTLVAGIVSALDNSMGVVGVAPEVELYAVKVLDASGTGKIEYIQRGIEWAIENDMDVINISFGSMQEWPSAIKETLKRAYDAGITIVAGAGNRGTPEGEDDTVLAPARYDMVIAVGATDKSDQRMNVSGTGSTLELMAPGEEIRSTMMGGGFGTLNKTSAASAHVSGVAALMVAAGAGSNTEIRKALKETAGDLGIPGWDKQYGYGLVSARDAVKAIKQKYP